MVIFIGDKCNDFKGEIKKKIYLAGDNSRSRFIVAGNENENPRWGGGESGEIGEIVSRGISRFSFEELHQFIVIRMICISDPGVADKPLIIPSLNSFRRQIHSFDHPKEHSTIPEIVNNFLR